MTLIDALKTIPDYRKARGQRHPLWIVLVVIVMGNLAGYWGNRPLEEFAKRYGQEIATQLQIELSSLPSYSTFRRVHLGLDFDAFSHAFRDWMSQYLTVDEETYAIDGKRIGQPITGEDGKTRFVGLVSVFAQHQGITVDLAGLTEAENSELKVVQYLLEKLKLTGAILTLDAAHAQKTLQLILESENDYVVAVKRNQARLHRQVESIVTHCKALQSPLTMQEQQRGRLETRRVSVFSAVGVDTDRWPQVKTIVCVDRQRQSEGKCTTHRAYYISSVSASSKTWMTIIRGHWSVENRLHWCKDVVLNEDKTYGREPNALLTASVFRSITINLLRINGFDSLTSALRALANQIHQIFKLLQ